MQNSDCLAGSEGPGDPVCCSFGQCTDSSICQGHKFEGDYCDKSAECQKGLECFKDSCIQREGDEK